MSTSLFRETPLRALVERTRGGEVSCEHLVDAALGCIGELDPSLNAFVSVQGEHARDRARELDTMGSERRHGCALFGIPVAVKDNLCTAGVATTCASRMLGGFVPPRNATVVEALLDAGAVVVGKTNLDEFAMGSTTETSVRGVTRNPAAPAHVPGGSSGGSAAAVAAGMVPAALGSDTGGSIRQPCSYCGCVGLKPTYGRVSRYGLVAFASSLDQVGPISCDCDGAGLLLEVLSRPDERDTTNARRPYRHTPPGADVRGVRIGIPREYYGEGLDDGVRSVLEATRARLEQEGAVAVEVSLPRLHLAVATYYLICTAEASSNLARYDGVRYGHRTASPRSLSQMYCDTRSEGFGAEVKRRIMLGTYVLSSGYYDAYYLKAARVRTLIGRDFVEAFTRCDCILSPVAPAPAPLLGELCDDPLRMYLGDVYTVSANLAGIPGLAVPCGTVTGLPVGAQLLGPHWSEELLLRVGAGIERVRS